MMEGMKDQWTITPEDLKYADDKTKCAYHITRGQSCMPNWDCNCMKDGRMLQYQKWLYGYIWSK